MKIKAEDLVAMLKKMDEVEEKAGAAFGSRDSDDLQVALEKMRELRSMLYAALAKEEESAPYPVAYPVIVPWWEQAQITCKSTTVTE